MNVIRAEHLGMCFGVRDAIDLALQVAGGEPLTVLGDLVHNETVLNGLRARGIQIAQNTADISTHSVMITAHGASQQAITRTVARGLNVIEATCPLVHLAHRAMARLVADGFHPVIIGQRDHVEVHGVTEDLQEFDVILSEEDVTRLGERQRYGVIAQTTQPIDRVRQLVGSMYRRFPNAEIRFVDTVCQPTKLRQNAAIELAQRCDAVIVIGGAHSNNTRELVATCARHCPQVHHVQTATDLCVDWFAGVRTVGLTAGTSTPDVLIDAVESKLHEIPNESNTLQPAHQWKL